jgi:hypothetical protein
LRAVRARSSATAAMAATRAAPTAIKAICHPAMPPPTVTTRTAAGGTAGPPGGIAITTGAAEALAADIRPAQMIAARAARSTPNLIEAPQAQIADPLWLLGKQWQTGELTGDDAASPVLIEAEVAYTPVSRFQAGVRAEHRRCSIGSSWGCRWRRQWSAKTYARGLLHSGYPQRRVSS